MSRDPSRVWTAAAVVAAFFLIDNLWRGLYAVPAYVELARRMSPSMASVVWKLAQVPLCILAVMAIRRMGVGAALGELGLRAPALPALAVTLAMTLPMLVTLVAVSRRWPTSRGDTLLMTGVASPLSEEILYRGFLFLMLYRRARWPFWAAVAMNALPFAAGHLYQARDLGFSWESFAEVIVTMGGAAAFESWVLIRWDCNLWIVVGLHAWMNVWWELFGGSTQDIYGWLGYAARFGTVAIVAAATIVRTRRRRRASGQTPNASARRE